MHQEENKSDGFDLDEDERSCLFLSGFQLYRVSCPFQVTSLMNNLDLKEGNKYTVEQVIGWDERTVLYRVFTKLYPHFYFSYSPPTNIVISGLK
ncbi:hypothetical protein [Adhaeribacter terreus]|uniref:Uncharacterized protein n=1 Tax=Adhaeribacter terreus TaxID=529703 RepID=A0ABW0EAI3_9BACT